MIDKYTRYGIYRFLDEYKNVVYIGKTNNLYRRLYKEHFTNRGHLAKRGYNYNEVARVDVIKLKDPAITSAMEIYLIDKYKPKWNNTDKRKDIEMLDYHLQDYYSRLEKWELGRKLKVFNEERITLNKKQNRLAIAITYFMFISIIAIYFIK